MKITHTSLCLAVAAMLCLLPHGSGRAEDDTLMQLKRAIDALREENRTLIKRLEALENKVTAPAAESTVPAAGDRTQSATLEQRVRELEQAKVAQEGAVRTIIQDTIAIRGPKINEAAALGGTISTRLARDRDFTGTRSSTLGLTSIDLEFDIKMSEWATGHMKIDYIDGKGVQFQTQSGGFQGVDRLAVDTGFIVLGNQQKFPPLLSLGRMVLPFGTSTGHPVTDALSIASALSVDAFEMRHNAIGLNFGFPTPQLKPRSPPVFAPPIRPKVIYPVLEDFGRRLGYSPPPVRPAKPTELPQDPAPPPYSFGVYLYDGLTPGGNLKHTGATLGYRAKGDCGKRYEDMSSLGLCPWAMEVALGYNSSVFNSQFLETEYDTFLPQIGRVPGVAGSLRSALGPFSLVAEWNSATREARFRDDSRAQIVMKPSAWQVSLGYQLGWNPWVKEIGAQGTYLSLAYSRSNDLFGVKKLFDVTTVRAGFVPRERLLFTFGEWIVDGVRFSLEYSHNKDYSISRGGTGRASNGIAAMLTYAW